MAPSSDIAPALAPAAAAHMPLRGILLMLLAVFLFVIMDATGKALTADYNIWQISWARYLFHLAILPVFFRRQPVTTVLRTSRLKLQLLRSALMLGSTVFFFAAVSYIPLAEATAIGFVSPLLVAAFSVPLLGEKVGPRRWAAVIVGFLAVMLIIRPGFGMIHWAYLLPLGSAVCFALYQITTRILSRFDSSVTTLAHSVSVGLLVTTIVVLIPGQWRNPDLQGWMLMILVGAVGGIAHYILIRALTLAPAALLAPFVYLQLVWAAIVGFVWFGDVPGWSTLGGTAVLAASGLYVMYRERKAAQAAA
ncbi:MAG TPA: DMT family transporter [Dongiaceae bacterium]|jgi:drug/metabolite transporter (DMT)-like permease